MKKRPFIAILVSMALVLSAPVSVMPSLAATPALSKTSMKLRVGKSKVLKVKNTTQPVVWSIKSGKGHIKLKNKQSTQVTVRGKSKGKAVVQAVITYSSHSKKTMTCKVKVKNATWVCPICGTVNDSHYCKECGYEKPDGQPTPTPTGEMTEEPLVTPPPVVTPPVIATPTATPTLSPAPTVSPTASGSPGPTVPPVSASAMTPSPTPTRTPVPTATPIPPDLLSSRYVWMTVNRQIPIIVQLYANNSATDFYNRINSTSPDVQKTFAMAPVGENEFADYLTSPIPVYASGSRLVGAGEIYLYDRVTLKLSSAAHESSSLPTRLGKVRDEDLSTLAYALSYRIDGKTWLEFAPYSSLG